MGNDGGDARPVHPWVAEGQQRVRFGVQVAGRPDWPAFLALVEQVEALGFDSFWAADHPLRNWDCWTMLAAAAPRTSRLRLGSLSSCVAYRSPALLARLAADVDHLSGGRLVLGLGVGDDADEFARMGIPFGSARERHEALAETVAIVRGLWGPAPFTYQGRHVRVERAQTLSPPLQAHVPLVIGGGGERRTLRQVARYADMSNFGPHPLVGGAMTVDDVRRKFAALRGHCEALGRPYDAILRSHYLFVLLAETAVELQTKQAAIPEATLRYLSTLVFAGTPDELVAYYQPLVEAGMQYFVVVPMAAGRDDTLRLLAERVLPALARDGAAGRVP